MTSGHSGICFKKSVCLSEQQCFLSGKENRAWRPLPSLCCSAAGRTLNLFFCNGVHRSLPYVRLNNLSLRLLDILQLYSFDRLIHKPDLSTLQCSLAALSKMVCSFLPRLMFALVAIAIFQVSAHDLCGSSRLSAITSSLAFTDHLSARLPRDPRPL